MSLLEVTPTSQNHYETLSHPLQYAPRATSARPDLVWRVFEDGVEHLVKDISITSRIFGEKTIENP